MYHRRIRVLTNHLQCRPLHTMPCNRQMVKHTYKQFVYQINPYSSNYINYRPDSNLIDLTFPSDYTYITNIKNNYNFKMVMYLKYNNMTQQIIITPSTCINLMKNKDTVVTMYTQSRDDLVFSFDAYKPLCKL